VLLVVIGFQVINKFLFFFLDFMFLAFQNKLMWVKDLPVMRKTEKVGQEVAEYDCECAHSYMFSHS
jgi:hypothetical protein